MTGVAEYSVGAITRAGERVALRVDDDGNWLATVAGRELKHQTRAKLITDIERTLRLEKKAVHIPITVMESKNNGYVTLKHGVVTGIHNGTGNLTVAWDNGGTGQLAIGYTSDSVLRRLTPDEEKELTALTKQAHESGDKLRNYTSQRHVYKGTKGLADQVQALLAKDGE